MKSMLEEKHAPAFAAWQAQPGQDTTAALLDSVAPLLKGAARKHLGSDDPLAYGAARRAFLDAVPRYDPQKASMSTFVFSQLRGLQRPAQRAARGISVPDRVAADRARIQDSVQSLTHELGREPTDSEVRDHAYLNPSRYERAMTYQPAVAQGALDAAAGGSGLGGYEAAGAHRADDVHRTLVYHSLGPTDQKIMELSLGLHGRPVQANAAIAARLKLSPGAISQRKGKIQVMLDELADAEAR